MRTRFPSPAARGFTVIELMVVMAIIGILAAVAVPSYQQHVVRSRRAQAASCTQEFAQFMERFYTTNLRYDQNTAGVAVVLPALACTTENKLDSHYTIGFDGVVAARTYKLKAVPKGVQAAKDSACGTLYLDQAGTRTTSTGHPESCF